ncbi:MAG TPA: hypothetical protein PKX21_01985 [Candidatus Pacearchaeota archaeon]|nr:hypothetical protein [Candidatus Pacearchaeota archaeon]
MFKLLWAGTDFIYSQLFPPFCLNCGRRGAYVCPECQVFLVEAEPACPACGQASPGGWLHQKCFSSLDRRIVAWENQGLAKRLIATINQSRASHLLEYLGLQALASFLKSDSYNDLSRLFSDCSVEIIAAPPPQKMADCSDLSSVLVQQIVNFFRNEQLQNQAIKPKEKKAVLVSLEDHADIKAKARELKDNGFTQVFSLVLVG